MTSVIELINNPAPSASAPVTISLMIGGLVFIFFVDIATLIIERRTELIDASIRVDAENFKTKRAWLLKLLRIDLAEFDDMFPVVTDKKLYVRVLSVQERREQKLGRRKSFRLKALRRNHRLKK